MQTYRSCSDHGPSCLIDTKKQFIRIARVIDPDGTSPGTIERLETEEEHLYSNEGTKVCELHTVLDFRRTSVCNYIELCKKKRVPVCVKKQTFIPEARKIIKEK
jgi:hypothetical protein